MECRSQTFLKAVAVSFILIRSAYVVIVLGMIVSSGVYTREEKWGWCLVV